VRARLEDDNEVLRAKMADEVERNPAAQRRAAGLRVASAGRRREAQKLLREARHGPRPLHHDAAAGGDAPRAGARCWRCRWRFRTSGRWKGHCLPDNQFDFWPIALHPDGERMAIGTPTGLLTWKHGTPLDVPAGLDQDGARATGPITAPMAAGWSWPAPAAG